MSVAVEKLEKNMAKLTIEVSPEEMEKAVQAVYLKQKGRINIPGFRRGKAPRKMIEKMYGAGIFYEDAANSLINASYPSAVSECGEEVVSQPSIDVVQMEAGKPFIYTAEVALKPVVTLGEYKGLEVPAQAVEVTEDEVEAEIAKEQKNNSRMVDVDDRAVADGDKVTLDFEGFVDGEAFEGGKGTDYPLTIGSGAFIPGFEKKLIGAVIGEETDVEVTFPEDYQAEELAGKPAVFKCTVKKIQVEELPELDDEFAMDVSEFDTLEEYRADVRKNLEEKKAESAKRAKEDAALDQAIANAQMDIPDPMVDTQVGQMLDDFSRRISQQGLSMEQYMQFTGMTQDSLREQMKPQALKRIQSRLVLEKIAEAEGIEVSDEKMDEEIRKMAEAYKMEADKLKEILGDAEKKQIREDLAVQEAAALIGEAAKETAKKEAQEQEDAE